MSDVRIRIEGETWITLEEISACYECETAWLREAYEIGLLGGGREQSGKLLLRVTVLDRVAEIVRLSRYQGLAFETIVVLLAQTEERFHFVVDLER